MKDQKLYTKTLTYDLEIMSPCWEKMYICQKFIGDTIAPDLM